MGHTWCKMARIHYKTRALSESQGLKTWERMRDKQMTIARLQRWKCSFQMYLNYHVSKHTNDSGDIGLLRAFKLVQNTCREIKAQDTIQEFRCQSEVDVWSSTCWGNIDHQYDSGLLSTRSLVLERWGEGIWGKSGKPLWTTCFPQEGFPRSFIPSGFYIPLSSTSHLWTHFYFIIFTVIPL